MNHALDQALAREVAGFQMLIRRISKFGKESTSRRDFMRQVAGLSAALPLGSALPLLGQDAQQQAPPQQHTTPAPYPVPSSLTEDDENFLNGLEHANFQFFWDQTNPETGLTKDRCNVRTKDTTLAASIASTGFGLTALCIGEKRGFVSTTDARLRVIKALSFIWHKLPTHRGFFYHFANIETGERIWDAEASSVDTAMLLCGILTCRQHFKDKDIDQLAHAIFDRVDWTWLSEDTTLLSHGWTPELGFIPSRWDLYSELMMMYLLGLGSVVASSSPRCLVRLEAHHLRVRRPSLHRFVRTSLRPPVFAGMVRLSPQARPLYRLLSELDHCHRRASALLSRTQQRLPCLQQCPLGHHRIRLRARVRRLGWSAGHGTHRRNNRAGSRRWLAPVPARRHDAGPAHHP